uniref:Uncharacterized protein n=1 Tax=Rhizophagus irregularis (strain DAOM 181602 / DAOM 197198 / MUCL 43194) TaxID=747089 RepID=U9TLR1_RHIID
MPIYTVLKPPYARNLIVPNCYIKDPFKQLANDLAKSYLSHAVMQANSRERKIFVGTAENVLTS